MRQIAKNYKIVSANTTDGLAKKVNKELIQGWVPTGGLAIVHADGKGHVFMQALMQLCGP